MTAAPTTTRPLADGSDPWSDVPPPAPREMLLSELKPGQRATVLGDRLDEATSESLRAMGLCREAKIKLCRHGSPCIVSIGCGCGCSCRVGLSKAFAERILVAADA